jgi:hypothetical protein
MGKLGINSSDIPFIRIKSPFVAIDALPLIPQFQLLPLHIIHASSIGSIVLKDGFQFCPANWATTIFRAWMALGSLSQLHPCIAVPLPFHILEQKGR